MKILFIRLDAPSQESVPPEDPEIIAGAIRRALTDDALIDRGVEMNLKTAKEWLDYSVVQP